MAGWFDGLFHGAAEVENRHSSDDGTPPLPAQTGPNAEYLAGFLQGVEDAKAVASFRRGGAPRRESPRSSTGFSSRDPGT
jgi:hypothetical protein